MNIEKTEPEFKGTVFYEGLIILSIVVLGFALRFLHLHFYLFPNSLDSVAYSYSALLYSRGEWLSRNATPKGFLFVLLVSFFFKILGPTFLASRLVSLLFGSLLPIITYFLGSELFDKKAGLLSALIVSINPLLILYSCLTLREMLFSFTWMCCIYFALRGFKGNTSYSILGGIFFALSSMTIEIGIFAGIGFALYFIVQKTLKNRERIGECKNLDVFLCSAFLTLVPLFIRDYLVCGEPLVSWILWDIYATPIRVYISLFALSVPYVMLFRVFFRHTRPPTVNRYSNIVKASLIGFVVLAIALVIGYFSGLFSGGLAALAAQSFTGFVKFAEYLALPESLGLFLILFSLIGIVHALKSSDARAPAILCLLIFLFSYATRAVILSLNFMWGAFSLNELLTWSGTRITRVTWPFHVIFRYITPFIPLFSIFASYGIFFSCEKLLGKIKENPTDRIIVKENIRSRRRKRIKVKKNRILMTGLIFLIIIIILFQFFYADADLRARADSDSHALEREYTKVVDWLRSQGSPVVYAFNPLFKQQYGEDKVVLLTDEELLDIVKRARHEKIEFIISDSLGPYSDSQKTLFWEGFFGREIYPLGYFKLVKSYSMYYWWSVPYAKRDISSSWHMAQIYKISLPKRTALVVQGTASTGENWVHFLSIVPPLYLVDVIDDEEHCTEHFTGDYDLIVLAEIQRKLEKNELSVLREKVEKGTTLIISGISPANVNLEENSYWLGSQKFAEAPKDAKWNITFTEDALTVLSEIDLNKSYTLYSESLWSSPTGCTGIEPGVVVYAKRVEDGATTIYAKPYFNGVVIFSGVRHIHASKAKDYELYARFMQNLLEMTYNNTLFPVFSDHFETTDIIEPVVGDSHARLSDWPAGGIAAGISTSEKLYAWQYVHFQTKIYHSGHRALEITAPGDVRATNGTGVGIWMYLYPEDIGTGNEQEVWTSTWYFFPANFSVQGWCAILGFSEWGDGGNVIEYSLEKRHGDYGDKFMLCIHGILGGQLIPSENYEVNATFVKGKWVNIQSHFKRSTDGVIEFWFDYRKALEWHGNTRRVETPLDRLNFVPIHHYMNPSEPRQSIYYDDVVVWASLVKK